MPRPRILLLGPPVIEHEGAPLEVDTRKAIALLAYLAITRRRHAREVLATLLWPEYGQTRSRAALRRTLSSLGRARAEGWLEADRESVGLNHDEIWVDADRFHDLLAGSRAHGHPEAEVCPECLPLLAEAAELYRDDFMAGFGLRDSAAFDDWQFFQAESLRRELAGVLEKLARGHGARDEWEKAIAYARRWLAMDTLHEPAHRVLMELYALSGQRAGALRQYRECVRILEQELGVSPLEATTQLYEAITEDQVSSRSAPRVGLSEERAEQAPQTTRLPLVPLVGRAAEWEALRKAYETARTNGRVVALEGEAGIGKTRLAEEFLDHIRKGGAATVTARCYAGQANLAYGPFVEGLSAAVGRSPNSLQGLPEHHRIEAARLLPGLAGPENAPAPLDTPGARSRFFEGIREALLAICDGPVPGILFLDDLHWADASSLDLLTYLVRRLGTGRPLFVLLTWRTEEVLPGHQLRRLIAEVSRAGTAESVSLGRLNKPAVAEMVRSVGNDELLGERLYEETEGLPLFLGEYLTAVADGTLEAGSESWALPGGVRDLLRGRLAAVGETGWQFLTTAAVVGRSFDFDTVREASGRGEEEAIEALEALISRNLVEELRDGKDGGVPVYDFSHEKLRTLVYEETSLARRRLLHRRIAGALASRTRDQETGRIAGGIAHHYRLARQDAEAAKYSKLAGDHARSLHANGDALAHYETALALGHPDQAALHEALGDLHTRLGGYGAALASYETAAALGTQDTLAAVEHKLGNLHARRGERELAESHYEAARIALEESGAEGERARLYADWSLLYHQRGESERAVDLARQALMLAEIAGDTRALAQAHNMLGVVAGKKGDREIARHHLEKSLALAETLEDPDARIAALNNLSLTLGANGEIGAALEQVETALALCASYGDRHREAALHNNLADLLHAADREEESMEHLKKAVKIFAEIGEEGALQPEIWKLVEW